MLITRPQDLAALATRLRSHRVFALDTEFERERTYWPKLQLIQVAVPDEAAVIDPLALGSLEPLYQLLRDPEVIKVTHAGRQDAELFQNRMGAPPAALYDTQIAAALVGYGEQAGYASLVEQLLGTRLRKTERVTDWGRRPLSDSQVRYALDDVRYLLDLRERLDAQLGDLGRTAWLEEELAFYADPATYDRDPRRQWLRVSGWRSLDRRGLAVLREVTAWREDEASARDVPRNRVVGDDVLIEIAARRPKTTADLSPLRRLPERELARSGQAILAAVARAMALPDSELPAVPAAHREDPETGLVVDLLALLLRKRARESRIAPSYLGTRDAVLDLVTWLGGSRRGGPPALLHGWRRELAGDELTALFEGKRSLRIDGAAKKLAVVEEGSGSLHPAPAPFNK
jgi:ribonuclease D